MVGVAVFAGDFAHVLPVDEWGVACGAMVVGVCVDVAVGVVVPVPGDLCVVVEGDRVVAVWAFGLEYLAIAFAVVDVAGAGVYGAGLGVCNGFIAVGAGPSIGHRVSV